MKKTILALLAVGAASAQTTGMHMMDGYGMMGSSSLWGIFSTLFSLGLFLLVWLWVVKLWKEVRRMK